MVSMVAIKCKYPNAKDIKRSGANTYVFEDTDGVFRMVWNTQEIMSWKLDYQPTGSSAEVFITQGGWWIQAAQYRIGLRINSIAVQDMSVSFETRNKKRFIYIDGKRYAYEDGMIFKMEKQQMAGAKTIVTRCSTPEIPRVKYMKKPTVSRW